MHSAVIRPARSSEMRTPKNHSLSTHLVPPAHIERRLSSSHSARSSKREEDRGRRSSVHQEKKVMSVRQDSSPIPPATDLATAVVDPAKRAEMFRKQQAAMFKQTKSR